MMEVDQWSDVRKRRVTTPQRVAAATSSLSDEIAGYQLSVLRKSRGLTQRQVAEIMGVSQRRVSAVERGDLDHSEISTIRSYIGALGGHVRIVAEFKGESAQIA